MQSMHQWESEKLNLHLEACLLAFSQTHPTVVFIEETLPSRRIAFSLFAKSLFREAPIVFFPGGGWYTFWSLVVMWEHWLNFLLLFSANWCPVKLPVGHTIVVEEQNCCLKECLEKKIGLFGTPVGGSHILIRASTINSDATTPPAGLKRQNVWVFWSPSKSTLSTQDTL